MDKIEPVDELDQLSKSVEDATELMRDQLNNISHKMLPVSIVSLVVAIGLPAIYNILLLWVPTSFILWVLWCIWSILSQLITYKNTNMDDLLHKYDELNNKRKTLGRDTFAKRLIPLSQAGSAMYIISAVILILEKAGIIGSPEKFSMWMPLLVDVLLIVSILGGPILYHHLRINDVDQVVNLYKKRMNLGNFIRSHIILASGVFLVLCTLIPFIYFVLPIWSFFATWGLYQSNANGFIVLLVLILQVLSLLLLSGYLTQLSARTEISNNVTNLSNIKLRINQLLS